MMREQDCIMVVILQPLALDRVPEVPASFSIRSFLSPSDRKRGPSTGVIQVGGP